METRHGSPNLRLTITLYFSSPDWTRRRVKERKLKAPRQLFPPNIDLPAVKLPSFASFTLKAHGRSHPDARLLALLITRISSLQSATFGACELSHWKDAKDHGQDLVCNWTSHPDYINHAQCIPFNLALRKLAVAITRAMVKMPELDRLGWIV
ncbi:hypothetical protein B0T14DRAFT_564149 [Immersiella caudata]|uniref:Uncharacterized protein n=1 Tax=Immersiella caudata TaxID=314043 RepID=A0AA39WW45_9PEZI|nr:hypothetical protein B0T14DRAFT_564149 [Immersiella caudata]